MSSISTRQRGDYTMKNAGQLLTVTLAAVTVLSCAKIGAQASSADTDKQFITTASQSDYTEMKFSQLAADKATNPRVKAYANKMISAHTLLEAKMKPFADELGVTPVTTLDADHQTKYDALAAMSGADFDKTYMTDMDADHHVALDAFKAEVAATTDPALKATVSKGESVVAQHTTMADRAVKMMGGTPAGM